MKPHLRLLLIVTVAVSTGLGWFIIHHEPGRPLPQRTTKPSIAASPKMSPAPAAVQTATMASPSNGVTVPLFEIAAWKPQARNTTPLRADEPVADRLILSTALVKPGSLPSLWRMHAGDRILLPLRNGTTVQGSVNLVKLDGSGWVRVGGSLSDGAGGSFTLSQKEHLWTGVVTMPASENAYLLSTNEHGDVVVQEKPIDAVICHGLPKKPRPAGTGAEAAEQAAGTTSSSSALAATMTIPALDSLPSATAVFYLDFDGEVVTDPSWNSGFTIHAEPVKLGSSLISSTQITDVWKRVAEDYKPFNISVTTIRARYDAASIGQRMRCVVTPTQYWEPSAGGIAMLKSFAEAGSTFSDDVPCWAFIPSYYNTADISGTISHEGGHTFSLSHDSVLNASKTDVVDEYYEGHGRWGPIMGTTYDRAVSQWSKCEFANGGNYDFTSGGAFYDFKEDDIAIIGNSTNGFGFQADEADEINGHQLQANTGVLSITGIIGPNNDGDLYSFATRGGSVTITANPAAVEPNLDVRLDLMSSTGILQTAMPSPAMNATITRTLAPGTYYVMVRGVGDGNPLNTGYSSYGSIGAYTITGTYPAVADTVPNIVASPQTQNLPVGSKVIFSVTATSNTPPTYQWRKGGNPISGATSSSYTITNAQPTHEGVYDCVVTNLFGSATSDPATLSLNFKPSFTLHPLKTTVAAGPATPLTLTVSAIGTPVVNFQWQKNSVNIAGATSPTLNIASPVYQDGGTYRCVATNAFGSVISNSAVVTVTSAPVITVQPPANQGVPRGGSATISLTAVGSPTLTYQWFKGVSAVSGATKTTLTLSSITDATAGTYTCVVKNTVNSVVNTVTSDPCVVTVGNAPKFVTQPAATTVDAGAPLSLSCTVTGDPTLNYQWKRDGVSVSTDAALSIAAATWNDRGNYTLTVSNDFGTAVSKVAAVTIRSGPIILADPVGGKVAVGGKKTLTVSATGSPTLKYQWRKDSTNISGATSSSYTVTGVATASYDVVVSNVINGVTRTATSGSTTVTVEDAPKIAALPASTLLAIGGVFTVNASVTGSPTLHYQWKKNGVAMPTQTTATLQLSNLQSLDAATYTLVATNDVGTATSTGAKLTLQTAPTITLDPLAPSAYAYDNVTLTTAATGSATLKYQWLKNGNNITGATSNKLTLSSVQPGVHDGLYSVRVTNSVGIATSNATMLSVTPTAAPTVTEFFPPQAKAGQYLRVLGTNLNWTTAVKFNKPTTGTVSAAFVIVSPMELLVTAPSGITSSPVIVTTRGGEATSADVFQEVSTPPNDLFVNAQIIPGTGGKVSGTMPATFTYETGEPAHAYWSDPYDPNVPYTDQEATFSAWMSFTPAISGTYVVSTSGSAFDTRVGIYTGTSVSALTPVGGNDDQSYDDGIYTSYALFDAQAGVTYHIAIDGYYYTYNGGASLYDEHGNYVLSVTRKVFAATERREQEADAAVTLGSTTSSEPAVIQKSMAELPAATPLQYTTSLNFARSQAADVAEWSASTNRGDSLFALRLDARTGALSLVSSNGTVTDSTQTLIPAAAYSLTLRVDPAAQRWGALLNGEWICRDQPMPEGVSVKEFVTKWSPGAGNGAHGSVTLSNTSVTADAP